MEDLKLIKGVAKIEDMGKDIVLNKDDILSVKEELKESVNTKHSTVNGMCEFESKVGYATNFKMEGKTLVNRFISNGGTDFEAHSQVVCKDYRNLTSLMTFVNTSSKVIYIDCYNKSNDTYIEAIRINPNSSILVDLPSKNAYAYSIIAHKIDGWSSKNEITNVMVWLEGDYTQNPPSYFEGLKSVGQGDKIEVLNYNENLFDGELEEGEFDKDTGVPIPSVVIFRSKNRMQVFKGSYRINTNSKDSNIRIFYYNTSGDYLYTELIPSNKYYSFNIEQDGFIRFHQAKLTLNGKVLITRKLDKKQISTTLRGIKDNEGNFIGRDLLNSKNNTIHRKYGEYIVTGDEPITKGYGGSNAIGFHFKFNEILGSGSIGMCNRFKWDTTYDLISDREVIRCITPGGQKSILITIHKSKLSTQDITGFKAWLKANPITIVYELATPIIEEIPNFNPQTFKGTNTLLINSGVVQTDAEFEVTNNLRNEIDVLKDNTTNVEEGLVNNIYGYQKYKLIKDNGYVRNLGDYLDLNNCITSGFYRAHCSYNIPHKEDSVYYLEIFVYGVKYIMQRITKLNSIDAGSSYIRVMDNGIWTSWQKITTTSTFDLLEEQVQAQDRKIEVLNRSNKMYQNEISILTEQVEKLDSFNKTLLLALEANNNIDINKLR